MDIYLYLEKNTFIHRLHPITKIFCLFLLFILAMIFNHPFYASIILLFVFIIIGLSKSLYNLYRIRTVLILLMIFCSVLWTFFTKGSTIIWESGFIKVYKESLFYAVSMGLRLATVLICGMIFLSCTKIEEFSAGLNKLGLPFSMSFALSLAFRLVPTFTVTTETVIQAQKSRGLDLESGGILKRIKKHAPLIIPIFIYSIRNADLLAMALESKSFGSRKLRTYYYNYKANLIDYLVLVFLLVLDIICIYIKLKGFGVVIINV
ncbi:TPA: energy-coupling factor transporter transmembrane protein EcfT [bacterium]|nr:energy-coupling factor transporter transmembrane protein EcfT [bacterium]